MLRLSHGFLIDFCAISFILSQLSCQHRQITLISGIRQKRTGLHAISSPLCSMRQRIASEGIILCLLLHYRLVCHCFSVKSLMPFCIKQEAAFSCGINQQTNINHGIKGV